MRRRARVFIVAWLGLASVPACASKAKLAPADAATPAVTAAEPMADDPDEYERSLARYEDDLRAQGVRGPDDEALAEAAGDSAKTGDRCTRICDLAAAICELEERVCDLAKTHADEPRYAQVCERAEADCKLASSACRECES